MHILLETAELRETKTEYGMSNSGQGMGVNGEALQLHAVIKSHIFLLQVTRESISVLQVTRESVSATTSHVHTTERAMKLKVRSAKLYQKIIIIRLLPLALLFHAAHT